jgi:hypothetical protein
VVILLPLALGAALAAALATPLMIDLSVYVRATAEHGGTAAVGGTLTCSAETLVSLEGEVVEALNRSKVAFGTFTAEVLCGTTPTPWRVTVASDGVPFRPGFASADVRAIGFDPESGIFTGVQSLVFLHLTRSGTVTALRAPHPTADGQGDAGAH